MMKNVILTFSEEAKGNSIEGIVLSGGWYTQNLMYLVTMLK